MKFAIPVAVDAISEERAKIIVKDCLRAGGMSNCIQPEKGESAIVLEEGEKEVRNETT